MQGMYVISVIDPEGRLNNRQLHNEFNARRPAQPEIRSRGNGKLLSEIGGIWKTWSTILRGLQIIKARRIQAQCSFAKDAVGAAVKEKHGLEGVANDGDAVLDVPVALGVTAWKGDGIPEDRNTNGPLGGLAETIQTSSASVAELLRGGDGDKGDGGNRANVKAANIGLAAHIEAAIGRRFPTAVSRDKRARSMEAQNVAALVHRKV